MTYADSRGSIGLPSPGLAGRHQIENAAVAVACIRHLPGFQIADDDIAAGVRRATWPARLQRLTTGKLVEDLPGNWQLWLDGGHNAAAAAALADEIETWAGDGPVHLVAAMLRNRDPAPFLAPLAPFITRARTVEVPSESATLTAEELAEAARRVGIDTEPASTVAEAVQSLADGSGGRILICGSLYLAGSVLAGS